MADLDVTIGLDYGAYKRGLKDVEASSARSAEVITRAFRLDVLRRGVRQAFGYAGEAVRRYAEDNAEAQRIVKEWDSVADSLQKGIGSDLVGAMGGFNAQLKEAVGWLERMRTGAVNGVAGAINWATGGGGPGETIADVDAARRQRDEAEAEISRRRKAREFLRNFGDKETLGDQMESLNRQGPEGEAVAARLRADATRRSRLEELKKATYLTSQQREAFRRAIDGYRDQSVGFGFEDAAKSLNEKADRWKQGLKVRDLEAGAGGGGRFARQGLFGRAFAGPDEERELRGRALKLQEEANKTLKSIEAIIGRSPGAVAG